MRALVFCCLCLIVFVVAGCNETEQPVAGPTEQSIEYEWSTTELLEKASSMTVKLELITDDERSTVGWGLIAGSDLVVAPASVIQSGNIVVSSSQLSVGVGYVEAYDEQSHLVLLRTNQTLVDDLEIDFALGRVLDMVFGCDDEFNLKTGRIRSNTVNRRYIIHEILYDTDQKQIGLPLVNIQGAVVGMIGYSDDDISYVLPSQHIEQLLDKPHIKLGWTQAVDRQISTTDHVFSYLLPEPEEVSKEPQFCPPVAVRGIYLTGYSAGNSARLGQMIDLVNETELNAMVIDVKDSTGKMTYPSQVAMVQEIGSYSHRIPDLAAVAEQLRENGIYSIARLVIFQDPHLAHARPDLAIQTPDGGIWREPSGLSWTDPYSVEVWDYNMEIAREVLEAGFCEIQWDYVRFPSDGRLSQCVFPSADDRTKSEVISEFLAYSMHELHQLGGYVSADIFGLVPTALDDLGIGQHYESVIDVIDYVCPMVYPSHYAPGTYGLANPDAKPYETIYNTLMDARKRHGDARSIMRPWLQDFSLGHRYGPEEVRAQIQAVYDAGYDQWLLWDPSNRYTRDALKPSDQQ